MTDLEAGLTDTLPPSPTLTTDLPTLPTDIPTLTADTLLPSDPTLTVKGPDQLSLHSSLAEESLGGEWKGEGLEGGEGKGCCQALGGGVSKTADCLHLRDLSSFFIIVVYSLLGATGFMYMEVGANESRISAWEESHLLAKEWALSNVSVLLTQTMSNLTTLHAGNWPARPNLSDAQFDEQLAAMLPRVNEIIGGFQSAIEGDKPKMYWDIWNAILFCMSVYTTIGFGVVAPTTIYGRLVTMLYAIIGLPLMLSLMADLGKFLLILIGKADVFVDQQMKKLKAACCCRTAQPEKAKVGPSELSVEGLDVRSVDSGTDVETPTPPPAPRALGGGGLGLMSGGYFPRKDAAAEEGSEESESEEEEELDEDGNPKPKKQKKIVLSQDVLMAVLVTVGWIFLCGGLFCIWEEWDYFESFYFFFITLFTIGFGDVYPLKPKWMVIFFLLLFVGLSLVTMCINVVQQTIEYAYMNMLKELLGDYMAMLETEGMDPNQAGQGLVQAFTKSTKAKILMPLLSKDKARLVINQFQEEAAAQGIELPDELMDIDPETGVPTALSENADRKVWKVVRKKVKPKVECRDAEVEAMPDQNEEETQADLGPGIPGPADDGETQTDFATTETETNTPDVLIEDYGAQVNLLPPAPKISKRDAWTLLEKHHLEGTAEFGAQASWLNSKKAVFNE